MHKLSGIKQVYRATEFVLLHFVVQLVYIVSNCVEQYFGKDICFATPQKTPKPIVLLEDAERPLDLNGTVQTQGFALVRRYPFKRSLSKDKELLGKMEEERNLAISLFGKRSYARMESISRIYGMEREEAAEVLGGWIIALRAGMLKSMALPGKKEEGELRNMKAALESTISLREDILEKNVNIRLALENLVLGFKQ